MIEFIEKVKTEVKRIIDEETKSGRFSILDDRNIDLIVQIIKSEVDSGRIRKDNFREFGQELSERKPAELIFIAAPTGAGKDTLVRKVTHNNPDCKYVVLNMDIFRHYYSEFLGFLRKKYPEGLNDRDYACQTNGFSYEIYYTIQRIILDNFPGTNVIITGTIRETDWVEDTFRTFKSNPYTQYTNKLFALAVPKKICAFSAIERYLLSINKYEPGTARYVSSDYYSDTTENFITNLSYFEKIAQSEENLIDVIEVYKRSTIQTDFSEDTLLYTSDLSKGMIDEQDVTATSVVAAIINTNPEIGLIKISTLLDRVTMWQQYLKSQGLYQEVLEAIKTFIEIETNKPFTQSSEVKVSEEKYPGSD